MQNLGETKCIMGMHRRSNQFEENQWTFSQKAISSIMNQFVFGSFCSLFCWVEWSECYSVSGIVPWKTNWLTSSCFSLQSLAEIVLTDDVMATMELILNKVDVSCMCHYALNDILIFSLTACCVAFSIPLNNAILTQCLVLFRMHMLIFSISKMRYVLQEQQH